MPQIVNLTLSPKQASDAKIYTPLVARELRIKESDIALLRIVKRSVDARRGALKVNLSLEAYIDKEEQPEVFSKFPFSSKFCVNNPVVKVWERPFVGVFSSAS